VKEETHCPAAEVKPGRIHYCMQQLLLPSQGRDRDYSPIRKFDFMWVAPLEVRDHEIGISFVRLEIQNLKDSQF
jgi:hypothetical protein